MKLASSSRILIAVSCLLAILLAVLVVVQYRWAGSVAEAEAERARNHLRTAASLLARDFDLRLTEAYTAIQRETVGLDISKPFQLSPSLKDLVAGIYLLQRDNSKQPETYELAGQSWRRATAEEAGTLSGFTCTSAVRHDVPALLIPVPLALPFPNRMLLGERCVYVKLNEVYLRATLLPSLAEKYFGKDAGRDFDLLVVNRLSNHTIYPRAGETPPALRDADIRQDFFGLRTEDFFQKTVEGAHTRPVSGAAGGRVEESLQKMLRPPEHPGKPGMRVMVRALQFKSSGNYIFRSNFSDEGLWQLQVRDRSGLLASSSLARWRQGNLLTSLAVEFMLVASIAFLVLATRRTDLAARQKMQFVAGVSHELRTPVSAIAMLSRNQADGLVRTPEQVQQYGQLIHQQSQRLSEMVEQTLQFAGIYSNTRKPMLRTVPVAELLDGAVAARHDELNGFQVQTEIAPGTPPVLADPKWLEEAIGNLLSNATKYSKDQRWIRVAAHPEPDGRKVAITVEDHGIGIDASDQQRLFEPFFRGQRAMAEQIPGNGLGLSLVRSAAEAHRGEVTFHSEPDRGSSFTLRLPAASDA